MRERSGAPWYEEGLEACRVLSFEVAGFVGAHTEALRAARPGSPFYTVVVMLFSAHSVQLPALILGNAFLRWISPRLLARVEHSPLGLLAAQAFFHGLMEQAYEPLGEWVMAIPRHVASFIASACAVIRHHGRARHVRVPGHPIVSLFDAALSSSRADVGLLVLPLGRLLADSEVISDFADSAYQHRLQASVCWLCEGLWRAPPNLYKCRMNALLAMAHDEATCLKMAQVGVFLPCLIGKLADADPACMPVNWDFFRKYAGYPRVLHEVLSYLLATSQLTQIIGSDSNEVLRRFFEWSIDVWKNSSAEIVVMFSDVVMPCSGRIGCILKARRTMFKDDERLGQLIEEYAMTLVELETPGTEKLLDAFTKHLAIEESKDDQGANRRPFIRREMQRPLSREPSLDI
jgi:hypothetical protein